MDQSIEKKLAEETTTVSMAVLRAMTNTQPGAESHLTLDTFGEQWIVTVQRVAH